MHFYLILLKDKKTPMLVFAQMSSLFCVKAKVATLHLLHWLKGVFLQFSPAHLLHL